jgi:Tol biopolymer transport system component
VGVDQESGQITQPPRELTLRGTDAAVFHAEWAPDDRSLAAVIKEGAGRHAILTVSVESGDTHVIHRFDSEHDVPGLGLSPDGRAVAFIAPAADGMFQVFRLPIAGGTPVQVTHDRTNKTQPSWSPDGQTIAFTVWSYQAQFWRVNPEP